MPRPGPTSCSRRSVWRASAAPTRATSPAGSSAGWPSRRPSPTDRPSCSPTSRPWARTGSPGPRSSAPSRRLGARAPGCSSRPTTPEWCRGPTTRFRSAARRSRHPTPSRSADRCSHASARSPCSSQRSACCPCRRCSARGARASSCSASSSVLGLVGMLAPGPGRRPQGRLRGVLARLAPAVVAVAGVAWSAWLLGGRDLEIAAGAALRVLCLIVPSAFVLGFIDPERLGDHLAQRVHLPARPVVAATAALQRLQSFDDLWAELMTTRRVRGIRADRGLVRRGAEAVAVTGGLLVGARPGGRARARDGRAGLRRRAPPLLGRSRAVAPARLARRPRRSPHRRRGAGRPVPRRMTARGTMSPTRAHHPLPPGAERSRS